MWRCSCFSSLTTQTAKDSTRCALTYAGLTFEGGAHDGDGPGTSLLKHFSALIENAWTAKTPRLEFVSMVLDLIAPGATMTCKFPEGTVLHTTFIPQDTDANEFRATTIRREVSISSGIFSNIISDLRKFDNGKRRKAAPFSFTVHH